MGNREPFLSRSRILRGSNYGKLRRQVFQNDANSPIFLSWDQCHRRWFFSRQRVSMIKREPKDIMMWT